MGMYSNFPSIKLSPSTIGSSPRAGVPSSVDASGGEILVAIGSESNHGSVGLGVQSDRGQIWMRLWLESGRDAIGSGARVRARTPTIILDRS